MARWIVWGGSAVETVNASVALFYDSGSWMATALTTLLGMVPWVCAASLVGLTALNMPETLPPLTALEGQPDRS